MVQFNFSDFPIIRTERLVLRQITANDMAEIYELRSDEQMMKYIGRPPLQGIEEANNLINSMQESLDKTNGITWGIELNNNKKLIGNLGFWKITHEHYRAELGYMLLSEFQGKGIMDEALKAILKFGFGPMNLHSVEANVDPENKASIRLLERNHFVREAFFTENFYFDGKFLNSAIYCLIKPNFAEKNKNKSVHEI